MIEPSDCIGLVHPLLSINVEVYLWCMIPWYILFNPCIISMLFTLRALSVSKFIEQAWDEHLWFNQRVGDNTRN